MERPLAAEVAFYARLLWIWLIVRTVMWTILAAATQPNAPLDLVEWLSWGFQFSWGYAKHPPLPGWVAGCFAWLSQGDVWGVYLAAYLQSAVCLWAAWRLGREFLPAPAALVAAVCLDGLNYLTGDAASFSNNGSLNAAWALTVVCFVRAVRTEQLRWWLKLGVVVGLGLLCKYTLGVLLVVLAGYLIFHDRGRRHLRRPGPYLALALALAIFAPHGIWLVQHDFLTFQYAAVRSAATGWLGHVRHPADFMLGQLVNAAPVLLVVAPLLRRRGVLHGGNPDLAILHWAVAGPVIILLGLSVATGCQLRHIWGSPLWLLLGVYVLALAGAFSAARLRAAARLWVVVMVGMAAVFAVKNVAGPHWRGRPLRIHYPGRQLAQEITRRWHMSCAEPFAIVAGEPWRAGNVCCYTRHRPMIYTTGSMGYFVFEPEYSPWASDAALNDRGGVILWDARQLGDALPHPARERFPTAEVQPAITLPYQTGAAVPPDRVGVAFVWPTAARHAIACGAAR